jgi:hypothetical protein
VTQSALAYYIVVVLCRVLESYAPELENS